MKNNEIDFFVSHSKEAKYSIAIPIAQTLTNLGYNVWIDRKGICLGHHIYSQIVDAIKISNYCIAIIDEAYLQRTWTITELEYFHEKSDNNILPIFVNLEKSVVYEKIPWLNGVAFEHLKDNNYSTVSNILIICRIINSYYTKYITTTLESVFESLVNLEFPCKNTLVTLINSKDYYSQDYRLAIISLCNIIDIVYAVFKSKFDSHNKVIYLTFQFSNFIKSYCYNPQYNLDYNIFITTYNSAIISLKELESLLSKKQ